MHPPLIFNNFHIKGLLVIYERSYNLLLFHILKVNISEHGNREPVVLPVRQ